MNAIGIDFDVKRVTVAVTHCGLWLINCYDTKHHKVIVNELTRMMSSWDATHVALERPYLASERVVDGVIVNKRNPQTHFQLSRVYGRIEVLCEQAGLVVVEAPPSKWQAAMLTPQHAKLGGRKQRKTLSLMVANALGAHCVNDHEADAVCMSEWLGKRLWLEQEAKA